MEYQYNKLVRKYTKSTKCKFRTKNWVELNDESRRNYNVNSQVKLKTSMLRSSLYDYSDGYIFVNATIKVPNAAAVGAAAGNIENIIKNYALFPNCISETNNVTDNDIVMPMYNLIEYSDNYSKTSGISGITMQMNHF